MPHYYDASRTPIQLDEAPDDVGVRFGHEDGAVTSAKAVKAVLDSTSKKTLRTLMPVRRFGRFMMLHAAGASLAPVEAVVNALPQKLSSRVARTMPVYIERESQLKLVATEQILVKFKARATPQKRDQLLKSAGLTISGRAEFDRDTIIAVPVSVQRASRALDLANRLVEADDLVAHAAPNFLAELKKAASGVNDPMFASQWHLDNTGKKGGVALQDARALDAWKITGGGDRSIVIAIIDDGIDLDHPDLMRNVWRNPAAGAKDRNGRDFVDLADPFNPRPKVFKAPFDDTENNDIHGTCCAGVAGGVGNNKVGVAGMAWNCSLMAVKIMAGPTLAPVDRIADAIRYASLNADVLSCSWGTPRQAAIESAMEFAATRGRGGKGAPVFVATGNEYSTRIGFPASSEFAIAVGACNDRGVRSKYSNYGKGISIVAPSSDEDRGRQGITTTDVSYPSKGYSTTAYCNDFGGTSSATPLAAGVAALMLSANKSLTEKQVRSIITSTADKIDPANGDYRAGYSIKYGFGRVNAGAAVAKAKSAKAKARAAKRRR